MYHKYEPTNTLNRLTDVVAHCSYQLKCQIMIAFSVYCTLLGLLCIMYRGTTYTTIMSASQPSVYNTTVRYNTGDIS